MVTVKYEKMNQKSLIWTFTILILSIVALLCLYFLGYFMTRQVSKVSTFQCPPKTVVYDQYFCQGADFSNYSVDSNNQGLKNGFVAQFGPYNRYNLDWDMELALQGAETAEGTYYVKYNFYGSNDREGWTKIGNQIEKNLTLSFSKDEETVVELQPRTYYQYQYLKIVVFDSVSSVKLASSFIQTSTNSETFGIMQLSLKCIFIVGILVFSTLMIYNVEKSPYKVKNLPNVCKSVIYLTFCLPLFVNPTDLLAMVYIDQPFQLIEGFLKYGFIGIVTTIVMSMLTYTLTKVSQDQSYGTPGTGFKQNQKFWFSPPVLAKVVGTVTFLVLYTCDIISTCILANQVDTKAAELGVLIMSVVYMVSLVSLQVYLSYKLIKCSMQMDKSFTVETTRVGNTELEAFDDGFNSMTWNKSFLVFYSVFIPFFTIILVAVNIEELALIESSPNQLKGFEMAFALWTIVFIWLNWPQTSVVKSKSYAAEKK